MRVRLLDETGTTHIRCWYDIGQIIRTNGTVRSLRQKIASEFNLHADSIGFEVEGFDLLDNALLVNILRDEDIIRLKHFKSGPLKRLVNAATSLFRPNKSDISNKQNLDRKPSVSSHLKAITSGLGKRKRRQDDTAAHKRIKSEEHDIESDDQVDSDDAIQDVLNDPYGTDPDFNPDIQDDYENVEDTDVYLAPNATLSRSLSLSHPPRHKMQNHPRSASAVEYLPNKDYAEEESEEEESDEKESDVEESDEEDSEENSQSEDDSEKNSMSGDDSSENSSQNSVSLRNLSTTSEEDSPEFSDSSDCSSVSSESDSDAPIPQRNPKRHTLSLPIQAPPGQGNAKTKARNLRKRRKRQALSQSVQSSSPDAHNIKAEADLASTSKDIHQQLNIRPTSADLGNKKKKKSFLKGQTERVGQHFVFDEDEASDNQPSNSTQSQNGQLSNLTASTDLTKQGTTLQPSTSTISTVISAVELEDLLHAPPQIGPEINLTPDRQWKPASSVNSFKKRVRKLASMDAFRNSPEDEELIVEDFEMDPTRDVSQSEVDRETDQVETPQVFFQLRSKDGKCEQLAVPIDSTLMNNDSYSPSTSPFFEVRDRDDIDQLPQDGDIIAFKVFEIGPNYTPRVSDFKVGSVKSVLQYAGQNHLNAEDMIYTITLWHASYKIHREKLTFDRDGRVAGGKFEMTDDSETSDDEMTLQLTWKEMHDVYILKAH